MKNKFLVRTLSILIVAVMLLGIVPIASAASPSSSANASATLAYTLKGLPLGRAVQNFYIGETYIYVTQRVDAITYLSRLEIRGNEAHYLDRMTFNNCGHGQSLDFYTYNGNEYFYMGCKSNDDYPDYYWSLQIARVQYKKDAVYDYTDLNRISYINYANKTASKLGTTYRAAVCVAGDYTVFRIQTKDPSAVTYSGYSTSKLNKLLDASKSVDMRDATAACLFSFTQTGDGIIRPNDSFQGIEMSSKDSIYLSGGADGDTPKIARMTTSGAYKKLITITNVGNKEIEGVQADRGKLYFLIVPETTTAAKKNTQQLWYIKESKFGISHSLTEISGTAPTCTKTGVSNGSKCSTCGFIQDVQEVLPAKGHTSINVAAVSPTCTQTGLTAGTKCSVCNAVLTAQTSVPALGHSYNSGILTTDPTCTQTGIKTFTCTACSDSYTQEVAATGHNYEEIFTGATCTEQGYTTHRCTACGDSYQTDIVGAYGHNYDDGAVTIAPTCTTQGMKTYTCQNCQGTKTEPINPTGHKAVTDHAVAPTCTESGLSEGSHCETCGEILIAQEYVAALGHSEVTDDAVAPTCTETGLTEGKHCSACNEILTKQEVVPATGHNFAYAPQEDDFHKVTCNNGCDYNEIEACKFEDGVCICGNLEACQHKKTTTMTTQKATCMQVGILTTTCDECGEITATQELPKLAHRMQKVEETEATCTQDGMLQHWYCSSCENSFADAEGEFMVPQGYFVIEKLGHSATFYPTKNPTCTENGLSEHYRCALCEEYFVDAACEYPVPEKYLILAATGHNFVNGICVCGKTEYVFDSNLMPMMAISVGVEIQVNYTILAARVKDYDRFYVEVVKQVADGEAVKTVFSLEKKNMEVLEYNGTVVGYNVTYTGIVASQMGDNFSATLYAVNADGVTYYGLAETSSIKNYLLEKINDKASSAEIKTLAVDMLNYGAAAQLHFGYNTKNLVNADMSEEMLALGTQTLPEATDGSAVSGNGCNVVTSVSLQSKVMLYVTCLYAPSENSNMKFVVKDIDGKVLEEFAPSLMSATYCQGIYANVGASQMRKLLKIELYDNDVLVSQTLTWSIESYVASARANSASSATMVNVLNAMLNYGGSAAAYLEASGQ